jgi:hypothetical protein
MDPVTMAMAIAEANAYTDSVALNGAPVKNPLIDPVTKHWMVFDPTANAYVDTGISAEGEIPAALVYTHTQATPAAVWLCQHNLGSLSVTILALDAAGDQIIGQMDAQASTINLLVYRFSEPLAGKAYIKF